MGKWGSGKGTAIKDPPSGDTGDTPQDQQELGTIPSVPWVSPQAWDLGKGLHLPQVTQSGVLVLALTLLSSACLAVL